MHGICHVEWRSTDLERTRRFYGGLFEWKFEDWGDGSYMLFRGPDGPGGGFEKVQDVKMGESPTVYVHVENLDPYLGRAVELGGGVMHPKMEVPGVGWIAILSDPDGNPVGLFQPAPH